MKNLEFLEPSLVIMMNDSFGKWIREAMPNPNEDRVRSEVQLAVLKERIRQGNALRKRWRTRIGLFATPVLLAMVISFSVVDLGGDGFDLMKVGIDENPRVVVKNEFRGIGFNADKFESESEIQEFNQQIAADQGVAIGVEGWKINGKTKWTILKEHVVLGKKVETGSSPQFPKSETPPEYRNFFMEVWDKYESEIQLGTIKPSGQMIQMFDGVRFSVRFWVFPTDQYGSVTYYFGKPIH